MSHSAAHTNHAKEHDTHKPEASASTKATPAPRNAAADAQKMLLLLTADWLNNDRTHSKEIATLLGSLTAAAGPPVNVDVPYVSQSGGTLNCTMGNWNGEPTTYAYAWHRDGGAVSGATGATYVVQPADSGHALACVVTATNGLGSTVAPMSNAIAIV